MFYQKLLKPQHRPSRHQQSFWLLDMQFSLTVLFLFQINNFYPDFKASLVVFWASRIVLMIEGSNFPDVTIAWSLVWMPAISAVAWGCTEAGRRLKLPWIVVTSAVMSLISFWSFTVPDDFIFFQSESSCFIWALIWETDCTAGLLLDGVVAFCELTVAKVNETMKATNTTVWDFIFTALVDRKYWTDFAARNFRTFIRQIEPSEGLKRWFIDFDYLADKKRLFDNRD